MKNKILTVLLSVALAFTIALATFNAYAVGNLQVGDTNGDGTIDLTDVTHLAQYVAGWDVELGGSAETENIEVNFNNSNEAKIWSELPNKKSVHVLMWRDYHNAEQALIDRYEEITGVDIVTTVTTEAQYPTKLVSMISEGNAPDLVRFSSNRFPGMLTKCLQPLDETKFDLDADCWNKNYMDAYKINGKYFGAAMTSSWFCEDLTYVTYYSPQLLINCGITTMPYDLYRQGKWNWDTQDDIIRKVKNRGFTGISLQSYDLFMHSAGVDFVSYDGAQFTNNLGSVTDTDLITEAWQQVSALKLDDCITGWNLDDFKQGNIGLFTGISYGMYNEGDWFTDEFIENIRAVPVAGPSGSTAYTPVSPACWGVPKNADNIAGAAYFLRYFLDVGMYDHSGTFYNTQFRTVFQAITSATAKKSVMYGSGVCDYVEAGTYSKLCNTLLVTTPANISVQLNSKKGNVNTGVSRANKDLANIN